MSIVDGGILLGRALANAGIEKAFVLCGGHIMPIFYGMRDAGIEIIDVRHECAAMYAAIAYAQASGKPAVVVSTAGPGIGNTPAGMMEAQSLDVPVIHIGGAVSRDTTDAGDLQDMSTLNVMAACSKWSRKIIHNPERIPEYVAMAFRHAMEFPRGPVYLEIPTDLVSMEVDDEKVHFPVHYYSKSISFGDPGLIKAAAMLLLDAKRPAIVVGDGARFSVEDRAGTITALSDLLKAPVGISGFSCRGVLGDEYANPLLNIDAMASADTILALGCRFDFRLAMGQFIQKGAKVIQVHTDARQIGFNVGADVGIIGGIGPVVSQLLEEVTNNRKEKSVAASWLPPRSPKGVAYLPDEYRSDSIPIHPARCAGEVLKYLEAEGRDWTVVMDGAECAVWLRRGLMASRPGQLFGMGPNGTMGTGPGFSIGAWQANRKPILLYTGDGSFGFYAMELETMARFGIPIICVISNDSAWGVIRLTEAAIRRKKVEEKGHCNCELYHFREYEKMAAMWGGYGESVKDPAEIIPAIKRATINGNGKPSIINVEVDQVSMSAVVRMYARMVRA